MALLRDGDQPRAVVKYLSHYLGRFLHISKGPASMPRAGIGVRYLYVGVARYGRRTRLRIRRRSWGERPAHGTGEQTFAVRHQSLGDRAMLAPQGQHAARDGRT